MIFLFSYEANDYEQAVRQRTKSEVSVIPKVGDEEKNFCVQSITPTSSSPYFVASKQRNKFHKATTAEKIQKKKKNKQEGRRTKQAEVERKMMRKVKEPEPEPEYGKFFGYFSGLSFKKQGICFFTFILKLILTFKI